MATHRCEYWPTLLHLNLDKSRGRGSESGPGANPLPANSPWWYTRCSCGRKVGQQLWPTVWLSDFSHRRQTSPQTINATESHLLLWETEQMRKRFGGLWVFIGRDLKKLLEDALSFNAICHQSVWRSAFLQSFLDSNSHLPDKIMTNSKPKYVWQNCVCKNKPVFQRTDLQLLPTRVWLNRFW